MNSEKYNSLVFVVGIIVMMQLILSCVNSEEYEKMKKEFRDVEFTDNFDSFDSIYAKIPNYDEVSKSISVMHAGFDSKLLLPYQSAKMYQSSKQTAFAIGMYIADLGYVRHFEKVQLCMDYLNAVNILAQKLAVGSKEFNSVVPQIESNLNNREELFRITDSLLNAGNIMLASNEKYGISALVLSGLWTESLYLGLASQDHTDKALLDDAIRKHFDIFGEINKLLDCLKDDSIISDIKIELQEIYKKGPESQSLLNDILIIRKKYSL